MPSQKTQKIDLNTEYPCPCRRRGALVPIALTEAFGCNKCQQIFVVEESGYTIEQLSTSYPTKKAWRWTGHRWIIARAGIGESYLPVALLIVLSPLILWLPLALRYAPKPNIIWILVPLLLMVLLALWTWLAYRRY